MRRQGLDGDMSDQRGQAPAAGGVEYAARRPIGPLVRPAPPPWATLIHVVGRRAPPDGAFYTELPNRLAAVPGSKTLSQVLNNTAICVLELAELKEVHEASMARAEAETAVALVLPQSANMHPSQLCRLRTSERGCERG